MKGYQLSAISYRVTGAMLGLCAFVLMSSAVTATAFAQESLHGSVVLNDQPVPETAVTLHRVGRDTAGVVAEMISDAGGRFEFTLPAPDPTGFTVYFAAAERGGVPYYGPPIHVGDSIADYTVEVYDTTSSAAVAESIRTLRRDVVMLPDEIGGWEVNEVVRLLNPSKSTLVSAGGMPTWQFEIPAGATDFQAGEGEVPADQVRTMGDQVMLLTPVPPGPLELFLRYRIPAEENSFELPVSNVTDSLNLFVRQPSPALDIAGLDPKELISVEDERFAQYSAANVAPDDQITINWTEQGPPVDPIVAAASVLVFSLVIGGWVASRRRA